MKFSNRESWKWQYLDMSMLQYWHYWNSIVSKVSWMWVCHSIDTIESRTSVCDSLLCHSSSHFLFHLFFGGQVQITFIYYLFNSCFRIYSFILPGHSGRGVLCLLNKGQWFKNRRWIDAEWVFKFWDKFSFSNLLWIWVILPYII